MADNGIFRVVFVNQGKVYEIYARAVSHASLVGFVEVEDLVFGTRSTLVMDPSEESLRREFEGVKRFFVPIHSIIRIDEVEKEGVAKVSSGGQGTEGVITPFPMGLFRPDK